MVILVSIAKIVVIISCRNWGGAGAGAGSDVWKRERRLSLHFLVILSKGGKQGTGDGQEFFLIQLVLNVQLLICYLSME